MQFLFFLKGGNDSCNSSIMVLVSGLISGMGILGFSISRDGNSCL